MQTRKRSLEEVFPNNFDVQLTSTLVEPSMLHFPTPESCTSAPSTPAGTKDSGDSDGPAFKKQRKRNKPKSPDDLKSREDERAAKNRRAAQESRDRKRQHYETLEGDNERLRLENQSLKERLESLEGRMEKLESQDTCVEETKEEDPAQTHCPAVVMSHDQQCQAGSLRPFQPTITRTAPSIFCPSFLNHTNPPSQSKRISTFFSTSQTLTIHPNSTTTSTSLLLHLSRLSLLQTSSRSCATLDSLNSGSLDSGAKLWVSAEGWRTCDGGDLGTWIWFVWEEFGFLGFYGMYSSSIKYIIETYLESLLPSPMGLQ